VAEAADGQPPLAQTRMVWSNRGNMTGKKPTHPALRVPWRLACAIALMLPASVFYGQTSLASRYQLFGGYSFLSNSLNGVSGHDHPLNGWDVGFAIPPWHDLRFKLSSFGYRGTSQGALEHPYFIMGGGQYGRTFGREYAFVEALGGEGNVNMRWGAGGAVGDTASFSAILGGGLDTPVSRHFAVRVAGDYQYAYFKENERFSKGNNGTPTYVPGLPTNFGRASAGLVWRF
jgi:hypothetical protein